MARIWSKAKQLTVLFLILTSAVTGLSFVPMVKAVMQVPSVTPVQGNVGTNVTVTGNLTTSNGGYRIMFDTFSVTSGNASGNTVNASFIVPEATFGNHTVTIVDSTTNENSSPATFVVGTLASINVTVPTLPAQLQEGDSIPIFLNITGYSANATLGVNFTVTNPANMTFTEPNVNVSSSALGSGDVTIEFPGNFQQNGTNNATTSLVGTYTVTSTATSSPVAFSIGLTNSTQYHRLQIVNVRAVSYAANETVALNVTGVNVQYSVNLTADPAGVINYLNFSVPANATIGTYAVTLVTVSGPTTKALMDTQNFTVPGFAFNVTARNRAGDLVPNAAISALENGTTLYNQTTDSNGLTVFLLEIGNFNFTGDYQGVEVGEDQFQVNGTGAVDFVLNLTDMNIKVVAVVNGAQIGLPDASINLLPDNETLTTDINGNAVDQSLLPIGTTYILNASRYNTSFNVTTISTLLVNGTMVAYYNVTIVSPSYNLQVDVSEANGLPFNNADVQVKELVGGIQYNGTTDSNGIVNFNNVTFGEYDVEVVDTSGNVINSTTVNLFQDQNVTVNCSIYGFNISVTVTDYFGQAFANTGVTLQGTDVGLVSAKTRSNGTAVFENLVGDAFTISVYVSGNSQPTVVENVAVNGTTAVSITLGKYVMLAGSPVELTQFLVVLIIVLSVLLIVLLEIYYMRKRPKAQKAKD